MSGCMANGGARAPDHESGPRTLRILVIDDNPDVHEDFRRILNPMPRSDESFSGLERALFGVVPAPVDDVSYELDSAYQGQEGLERLRAGIHGAKPHAMAFVDMRMPPGWDGVRTSAELRVLDPQLLIVICSAYSDFRWEEVVQQLGDAERLYLLRKPFTPENVRKLTRLLGDKWSRSGTRGKPRS